MALNLHVTDPQVELANLKLILAVLVDRAGGSIQLNSLDMLKAKEPLRIWESDFPAGQITIKAGPDARLQEEIDSLERQWPQADEGMIRTWAEERIRREA